MKSLTVVLIALLVSLSSHGLNSSQCKAFVSMDTISRINSNFDLLRETAIKEKATRVQELHTTILSLFALFYGHMRDAIDTPSRKSHNDFTLEQIAPSVTREMAIQLLKKAGIKKGAWEDPTVKPKKDNLWSTFAELEKVPAAVGQKDPAPVNFYKRGLSFNDIPQIVFEGTYRHLPRKYFYGLNETIVKYEFYLSYILRNIEGSDRADGTLVSSALRALFDYNNQIQHLPGEMLIALKEGGFTPMAFSREGLRPELYPHYPFVEGLRHEIIITIADKSQTETIAGAYEANAKIPYLTVPVVMPRKPGTYGGELIKFYQAGFVIRQKDGTHLFINTNYAAEPIAMALRPILD